MNTTLTGAGIGAVGGALIGSTKGSKNAAVGGLIGAGVGALAGFAGGKMANNNEVEAYEIQIEDFAKEQMYNTLIKSSVYTTKAEGKLKYERDNNKVDFDYVALAYSTVSDEQVKVTDEEIIAYMKKT